MSRDSFLIINSTKDVKFVFFSVNEFPNPFAIPVYLWKSPEIYTPQQELIANNKFPLSSIFEVSKDKIVLFKKGKYNVTEFIIIPQGYDVKFEAGTILDFQNNAGFISYSPVEISGSINEPVTITSSDGTAMGFTVLQANKKSIVNYTVFNNLNTLDYNGWTLTGAVNFYESDVDILNTDFDNNLCEDALNIIRSDFNLRNCLFENIFADAFDSDFSDGNVIKTVFQNIGNDAIDFSGSKIYIDSCEIINARDKGISAGEISDIIVKNTLVKSSNIGFADRSGEIRVKSVPWGLSVQHGVISAVRVIRGSPCGASLWAALQLIDTPVADAPAKAGLSVQQYPCRAVRGIRGGIHKKAVETAVA